MDGYIRKQTAIELIERMKPFHLDADSIAEMIDNMISEDVVEAVRCKDCVYFEEHKNYGNLGESAYTCAGNMDGWIYTDSYCSNGRRKDG